MHKHGMMKVLNDHQVFVEIDEVTCSAAIYCYTCDPAFSEPLAFAAFNDDHTVAMAVQSLNDAAEIHSL